MSQQKYYLDHFQGAQKKNADVPETTELKLNLLELLEKKKYFYNFCLEIASSSFCWVKFRQIKWCETRIRKEKS